MIGRQIYKMRKSANVKIIELRLLKWNQLIIFAGLCWIFSIWNCWSPFAVSSNFLCSSARLICKYVTARAARHRVPPHCFMHLLRMSVPKGSGPSFSYCTFPRFQIFFSAGGKLSRRRDFVGKSYILLLCPDLIQSKYGPYGHGTNKSFFALWTPVALVLV